MRQTGGLQASIVLAALVLLVPQTGSAGKDGPPYLASDSYSYDSCLEVPGIEDVLGACSATATADHLTGALGMDLRSDSPLDGALPGYGGSASGNGEIRHVVEVKRETPVVTILVTVHVSSAEAVDQEAPGILLAPNAYANVSGSADAFSCYCYTYERRSVVDASFGPGSRSDEDIILPLVLTRYDGGPVTPGPVRVSVYMYGTAGAFWGSARVLVNSTVTSIGIA
jgi:hypothetical protein